MNKIATCKKCGFQKHQHPVHGEKVEGLKRVPFTCMKFEPEEGETVENRKRYLKNERAKQTQGIRTTQNWVLM